MKNRRVHLASVTPYTFWAQPDAPPQYEWMCVCGELASGFPTEQAARSAADGHEERFGIVRTSDGHASLYDPATGRWEAASAILAVSATGWVAFGVVVGALLLMIWAVCVAIKRGQGRLDEHLPAEEVPTAQWRPRASMIRRAGEHTSTCALGPTHEGPCRP